MPRHIERCFRKPDLTNSLDSLVNTVTWQVQTAKQRFSELVERAVTEGPQISHEARQTVVVM